MAINFPTSLDNFTNPSSGNTLDSPSHSLQHSDLNDAVEALETKLGVGASPAGSATAGQVLTISSAGTSAWTSSPASGLVPIIPSSIAVTGTASSGSVNSIGAVSFSTATGISLNDVFSSTYDFYRIVLTHTIGADADIAFRLRVSGSDNSTSNYKYGRMYIGTIESLAFGNNNATTSDNFFFGEGKSTVNGLVVADLFNPFATKTTALSLSSSCRFMILSSGMFNATTSFTGFTIYPAGVTTMTGLISVYGYRI